jgi:arabinan endo-1,5-alpha-L-arabinosidase
MFSTSIGLEIRTSSDRAEWKLIGKAFPEGTPWTDKYTGKSNGQLASPDCNYIDGEFYVYYSANSDDKFNAAIFLAKSTTGMPGSWSHEGLVTSTDAGTVYTAMVPNLLISKGLWWLAFGSQRTGIKLIQLKPEKGMPLDDKVVSVATRVADYTDIEGSNIYKHGNYFYIFTTWDQCCMGPDSTYNIRVGRSWSLTGPYLDKGDVAMLFGGGSVVLESHDDVNGPGGQDILVDDDGVYLIYHYYTKTGSWLGMNKLNFTSGWPVVE